MWFNNALIFQFELNKTCELAELLAEERLKPCPPHARFIYGWLPVFNEELSLETAECSLLCLGKEERILPRGVVKRILDERVQLFEAQNNRSMKRAQKAQLAEELEFELLPKAFCLQKRLPAIIDYSSNRLIINTASNTQATQLIALLRKSIPGISIEPLEQPENLAMRFASWINNPLSLPANFQLASDCLLFSLDDESKRFSCKGYELPADEITTLLSQGLAAAEISVIWNDRIQLTLTHNFVLKKLKCLDYLVDEFSDIHKQEEEDQQQVAALTLLTGELRGLINDLVTDFTAPMNTASQVIESQVVARQN